MPATRFRLSSLAFRTVTFSFVLVVVFLAQILSVAHAEYVRAEEIASAQPEWYFLQKPEIQAGWGTYLDYKQIGRSRMAPPYLF
jgi:hypothetical protein